MSWVNSASSMVHFGMYSVYARPLMGCLGLWQVAGTFDLAAGNAEAHLAITRVPAGLSAYCPAPAFDDSSSVGIGTLRGLHADGTAVSDFRLASTTGITLFELAELQLKPIRSRYLASTPFIAKPRMNLGTLVCSTHAFSSRAAHFLPINDTIYPKLGVIDIRNNMRMHCPGTARPTLDHRRSHPPVLCQDAAAGRGRW